MARRFAVVDIDGVVYRWQLDHAVMFELADMGAAPGFRDALRQPFENWKNRTHPGSYEEYVTAFDSLAAQYLNTVPLATVHQAAQRVVNQSADHVYTYTMRLIAELRSRGYVIVAISGSLREIVQPFAQFHGFDLWRGQSLGVAGKYFADPYGSFSPGQKAGYLLELCQQGGLDLDGSVGVGDTMTDVSMLEIVERPIAFNPDQELLRHATQRGWKIVVERKNVVYELSSKAGTYILDQEADGHLRPTGPAVLETS